MKDKRFKKLRFIGSSLDDLRNFPAAVRGQMGHELLNVQYGEMPKDWKPMPSIGKGVYEIRIRGENGAFRVIYVSKYEDAIYVLHAFQKKSEKTNNHDIDLAKKRLRLLEQEK